MCQIVFEALGYSDEQDTPMPALTELTFPGTQSMSSYQAKGE